MVHCLGYGSRISRWGLRGIMKTVGFGRLSRWLFPRPSLSILLLVLGLSFSGVSGAVAAPSGATVPGTSVAPASSSTDTFTSGIQVQNVDTSPITVTLVYYNTSGTMAGSESPINLNPGQKYTFDTFSGTMHAPAGFSGSAVVQSTGKVAAITNVLTTSGSPSLFESYGGLADTTVATSAYLPLVQHNNSGYSSNIYIQNTDPNNATSVTITFYGPSGQVGSVGPQSILVGGSWTYDLGSSSAVPSSWTYGSATVSASLPVAVLVSQSDTGHLLYYNGFSPSLAGTASSAPLLFNRHLAPAGGYGWITGFQVQNIDASQTAQVQLVVDGVVKDSRSIPPQSSYTWSPYLNNAYWGEVDSGTVVSTNGVKIIGVVNELNPEQGQAMAYNAFASGSATVNMPLTQHANHGWESAQQVQNIGGSSASATYTQYDANGNTMWTDTESIPAGGQFIWSYYSMKSKNWPTTGSATVTASGGNLVATVNQINPPSYGSGDASSVYDAINE